MRVRSGCAGCAVAARAACDARPPDPARARGGRAAPWLVPASLSSRPQPGAWQIVSGCVRPHEKHITRTACAPGARCGASAARRTRRAADLCFRGPSSAGLAPAPSGKAGAGHQRASPRARGCLTAPARRDRAAGGRAHRPWHGSARQAACDHAARWRLHENRRFARMALVMLDKALTLRAHVSQLIKRDIERTHTDAHTRHSTHT